MATENNGSTVETTGQEQQGQQQTTAPETGGTGGQQQVESTTTDTPADKSEEPIKLPDDHPLVKSLASLKSQIATHKSELTELRGKSAKVTQLEDELKARPTTEAVETLQKRYDRLEEFLGAVGGPLSKALDSRTFTKDLFESDKDMGELVKDWQRANPTATSTALSSAAAEPAKGKHNQNDLLRAAMGR